MSDEIGHAPQAHLARLGKLYPKYWRQYERMRADRGKSLPDWPPYVYAPMAASYAVVSGGGQMPLERATHIAELAALSAWRVTKGIYRLDATLEAALAETPITGDIPSEALRRLPEWCVYLQCSVSEPELRIMASRGVFAWLEHDANDAHEELRLLVDVDDSTLIPLGVHLGGTVQEGLDQYIDFARRQMPFERPEHLVDAMRRTMSRILSYLLYLCADEPDYDGGRAPLHPSRRAPTKKANAGAQAPQYWDVGARIGAALRLHESREQGEGGDGRSGLSPRPHVRRAHWHTYWMGKRGQQTPRLKWLSPVLVGARDGIVPTVREVS